MTIDGLKDLIKDYAKDVRVNVGNVLAEEIPGSSAEKRLGVFLATAYATKNADLIKAAEEIASPIGDAYHNAAKTAATLMAMNNVYYRFLHLNEDAAMEKLPAKLRMQGLAAPGIPKDDFELMSLAVSAFNGCGMCMKSHRLVLEKHGVDSLVIQQAVRIAAVTASVAQGLEIN